MDCAESVRGRHSAADGRTVPARGPRDDPGKRRAREEDPAAKPHVEGPHAREVSQTGESRDTRGEQSSLGRGPRVTGSMRGQPVDARGNHGNMPRAVAVRAAQPLVSDSE